MEMHISTCRRKPCVAVDHRISVQVWVPIPGALPLLARSLSRLSLCPRRPPHQTTTATRSSRAGPFNPTDLFLPSYREHYVTPYAKRDYS